MERILYGLLGYPLEHSFSVSYFKTKFLKEHINADYCNIESRDLQTALNRIVQTKQYRGFNVTIPYKINILPFLDQIHPMAQMIGAVNVVKIIRTHTYTRLIGYNSDYESFFFSIKPLLKSFHRKALILGTGGASRAVQRALGNLLIPYSLVSRKPAKANIYAYEDLNELILKEHQIIINCTPVGMYPMVHYSPNIPYRYIGEHHLLYDLIYNPKISLFLKQGIMNGAIVKNGQEMLEKQAEYAWQFWQS